MKTKLLPYTIISNCAEFTDIRDGINEIQNEMKSLVSEGKDVPHSSILGYPNSRQREKRIEKPDSHECDHPCFHRRVNAYNGSSPFPVLPNIAIFSQRK